MVNYLRRSGLLLLILACAVHASFAQAPTAPLLYADDLAALGRSAAASGVPIMLVFTRPGCPYCVRAKQVHLEPLGVSPGYGSKFVVREIEASNELIPLRDFDGVLTTHGDFARKHAIKTVPTVVMVGSDGKPLSDPLVGLNVPEFYNLYLEQAIDAARLKLRARE